MRYLSILLLVGCVRSELPATQSVDCGAGVRAVVDYTVFCVVEDGICPEVLPVAYRIADRVVCAELEGEPEAALLAAARQAAGAADDGGASDGRLRDRGLVDVGLGGFAPDPGGSFP